MLHNRTITPASNNSPSNVQKSSHLVHDQELPLKSADENLCGDDDVVCGNRTPILLL